MDDRKATWRMTPIMRWRWELLAGRDGHVYHAVEPVTDKPGESPKWVAACKGTGVVSVRGVGGEETCLACFQYLARADTT
jgi:hypothetical protein